MRLPTITASTLSAVLLLAGCGSGTDSHAGTTRTTPATPATSGAPASSTPVSSAPPAPSGPVFTGTTYSIVLPGGSKALGSTTGSSRSFQRGLDLDGQFLEEPCSCRSTNDAKGLSRLVDETTRFDKVTYADVRRAPDATIGGYRFARVTGHDHNVTGDTWIDSYITWYAGNELQLTFRYRGDKARHTTLEALVDQSLTTFRLKG